MKPGKPTAASVHFPYRHRDMAEVLRDESWGCHCSLPKRYGHKAGCRVWAYQKELA